MTAVPHCIGAVGLFNAALSVEVWGVQIFLGGLPYHFSEEQCRQLLEPFGDLQSFELVRDREKGESKGYGFAVFADKAVTDTAIVGLNGLSIDGRVLTCRKCAPSILGTCVQGAVCHVLCGTTCISYEIPWWVNVRACVGPAEPVWSEW